MQKVAIIGGGITGLSTACTLKKAGIQVRLFEASKRLGGVIQSWSEKGFLAEAGPNTLQVSSPQINDFLKEYGLEKSIVESNPTAKKRYIVHHGHLVPAPLSFGQFLKTPLFSLKGKFRILSEPFTKPAPKDQEENLAEFTRRRLGSEVLDYAINPFTAGIYAGDPTKLSVKYAFPKLYTLEQKYGSLIKGALRSKRKKKQNGDTFKPRLLSFRNGMETLPRKLGEQLGKSIHLETKIESINHKKGWYIRWAIPRIPVREERFDALVISVPTYCMGSLAFEKSLLNRMADFQKIVHPPIAALVLGFERKHILHPLDGFGLLVPEKENLQILGTLFSSTLFPNRAPRSCVGLTTFVGGSRQPELARWDPDSLKECVLNHLDPLLGVAGKPIYSRHIFWPQAIPQYNVGYGKFIQLFDDIEQENPGLYFAGHFRNGVALEKCIQGGIQIAQKIIETT